MIRPVRCFDLCPTGQKVTSVDSGTAAAVWSLSLSFSTLAVQSRYIHCLHPAEATAPRCWTTVHPIPAWTTVPRVQSRLHTARWTLIPTITGPTAIRQSTAIRAACQIWSPKTPAVTPISKITTDHIHTMWRVTPALIMSPALTELTFTRANSRVTITSTPLTQHTATMGVVGTGTMEWRGRINCPRTRMPLWGLQEGGRGTWMRFWQRICTRLWWLNIWRDGTTAAPASTGTRVDVTWFIPTNMIEALSIAWVTRPCRHPSATPAEPTHSLQVLNCSSQNTAHGHNESYGLTNARNEYKNWFFTNLHCASVINKCKVIDLLSTARAIPCKFPWLELFLSRVCLKGVTPLMQSTYFPTVYINCQYVKSNIWKCNI